VPRCDFNLDVPAKSQVIVKVLAMEVDCPYDYVQFSIKGQQPLMRLCPLTNVKKTYTMLPRSDRKTCFLELPPCILAGFDLTTH
jgi:hypothetical protein